MRPFFTSLFYFLLCSISLYSQYFESNHLAGASSYVKRIDTLGNTLVAHVVSNYSSSIRQFDLAGNLISSNNETLYTGGAHGTMKLKNGSVFFHAFVDHCDYYSNDFFIYRFNSNLQIENSFQSDELGENGNPFSGFGEAYPYSKYAPISDSIIAIASYDRIVVLDIENAQVIANKEFLFNDVNGLLPLTNNYDSILVYGQMGIFLYHGDSTVEVRDAGSLFLEEFNGFYYSLDFDGLRKLDHDFNELAYYSQSFSDIQFHNEQLHCLVGNQIVILDQDLNLVSEGSFEDNANYGVFSYRLLGDHYYTGGANGVTNLEGGATYGLKSYSLDFETEFFHQDIGITDVDLVGYNFYPGSIFNGNVMNYNLKLSLDVTVTNFTDNPVLVHMWHGDLHRTIQWARVLQT